MKKLLLFITVILFSSCATKTAEQKSAEQAYKIMVATDGLRAIRNRAFVLEADRVYFNRSRSEQVLSSKNFVIVKENKAIVQLEMSPTLIDQKGLNSLTFEGTISKSEMKTDKNENIIYTMHVDGASISAIIYFKMTKETNAFSATITPGLGGQAISFDGQVIPVEKSAALAK